MSASAATNGFNGLGEAAVAAPPLRRTIPFDYAFRYDLTGQRDFVQNSTVEVSIEASFTAVSIGYGVVPKVSPIEFGLLPPPGAVVATATSTPGGILSLFLPTSTRTPQFPVTPFGSIVMALGQALDEPFNFNATSPAVRRIGPRTAVVLKDGFRLNPAFAEKILLADGLEVLSDEVLSRVFQAVAAPPDRVAFKYAIFDEGSGREFQSEPIFNIAGLGSPEGRRPFRYFARPIEFAPRSAIRMQITEVSEFQGELHISLQGFKTLGESGTPTSARRVRRIRRVGR
jgi:hypothetical protein